MSAKDFDENSFVQDLKRGLDDSIEQLDSDISARLDQMRREAVAGLANLELDRQQSARLRQELDRELDPTLAARLNQARERAVAGAASPAHAPSLWFRDLLHWLESYRLAVPASVFATACVIITVVSLSYNAGNRPAGISIDEEILLVASADDIELYENLDFYLWLADNGLPDL